MQTLFRPEGEGRPLQVHGFNVRAPLRPQTVHHVSDNASSIGRVIFGIFLGGGVLSGFSALFAAIGAEVFPALMTAAGCGLPIFCAVAALSMAYFVAAIALLALLMDVYWQKSSSDEKSKLSNIGAFICLSLPLLLVAPTLAACATLGQAFLPHFLATIIGSSIFSGALISTLCLAGVGFFASGANQELFASSHPSLNFQ